MNLVGNIEIVWEQLDYILLNEHNISHDKVIRSNIENKNIETLRGQIDYMLLNDCDISDNKLIKLSTELDELINRYYSNDDKSNFSND